MRRRAPSPARALRRAVPGPALVIALASAASLATPFAGVVRAEAPVPEPAGYRTHDYDAPVPAGLAGATTVAGPEVVALLDEGAVVVDVIPAHRAPATLPEGQAWLPPPHRGVEGALWLPDTGFGALAPVTERYLLDHLGRAAGGDRSRALVFYCRIDCWMSWNAAKRALAAGWTNVHWYRDGIDDWEFEGLPIANLVPAPGPRLPGDAPGDAPADAR